jgi:probable F420-dependent oxidoreductase
MRFGFILPNILSPISHAGAIRATARLAEDVGFESLWVSDHILMPEEHARYGSGTEALVTLAYVAGMTQRVALGLSVLVLPMRNPIIAAKQIASLSELAGREVIAGLGVGWCREEYEFLNADFGQRGRLLDEYIAILRTLWHDEKPAHNGTYAFSGALFAPRVRHPLPVWIGGTSDAAIRRAAAVADGYQPTGSVDQPEVFAQQIDKLRAWSNGRRITISMSLRLHMEAGASQVIDQLNMLAEAGLEYPALRFQHETLDDLTWQLEVFGRDVMPALAKP